MNILYHFRTRGTGAEAVHIAGIATAFEKLGHQVTFSSPTGVDPRLTAGSNPYKDPGKAGLLSRISRKCPGFLFELLEIGYNLAAYRRNKSLLNRGTYQLIYERHAFFLVATAFLAKSRGILLVVEVNELVGDARIRKQPLFTPIAKAFDKIVFRQAKTIVVVSPHLKRRIEALGIPGEKVLVLPNAVNKEEFAEPAEGAALRKKFCGAETVAVGFIGWFVEWHRLEMLLEVFANLAQSRPQLQLVLIGEGTLRQALTFQAESLGIADRVVFAGALPHQQIPAAIRALDICVVPHSNEYRSPIKLFEYMGQGRLTVAPDTEPIAMVIQDGKNGLLFRPGDAQSMEAALTKAVDDPALRQKIGDQARADILSKHTWQDNAEKVLNSLGRNLR